MSLYSLQIKFQITWFYQADPCDGTSDYSSRESSSEETIGGLSQVEFRGILYTCYISRKNHCLLRSLPLPPDGVERKKNWKSLLFTTRFLQMSCIALKPL